MLKIERQKNIMEIVRKKRVVAIRELSKKLAVSISTIHRDLNELKENNPIDLIHGGVIYNGGDTVIDLGESVQDSLCKIGEKAFELIKDNEMIIIDAGRTTLELAKAIIENKPHSWSSLSIITTNIASLLTISKQDSNNINITVTGGEFRGYNHSLVGHLAEKFIQSVKVNKAFIGATGITEKGFYTTRPAEVELRRAICESAQEVILLVDDSKFGNESGFVVNPIPCLDKIVTDRLSKYWQDYFRDNNIEVILAK